jgi:hypothetical protein
MDLLTLRNFLKYDPKCPIAQMKKIKKMIKSLSIYSLKVESIPKTTIPENNSSERIWK